MGQIQFHEVIGLKQTYKESGFLNKVISMTCGEINYPSPI